MEPRIAEIIAQLDDMADEIQSQDPVIAFAIDQISDRLERTAGFFQNLEKALGGAWMQVKGKMRNIALDKAIGTLADMINKDPSQIDSLSNMIRSGLGVRPAFTLKPIILATIFSALTVIGAARAFDTLKEQVESGKQKQVAALEQIYKQLK